MRAWLAHADVHRIAVFADARDEGLAKAYIKHYGFRLWAPRAPTTDWSCGFLGYAALRC
jgi:hypothetical protein